MKFGICNEIFQGWKIEDAAEFAAQAGYDALEIAPFTIAPYVTDIPPALRQRVRQAAARAGITISGIHWVLARTEGLHLTHPDPAIRERTSNYLCDLVDFCADLGGQVVVLGSPKQRSVLEGTPPRQAWDWATEAVRASVTRALDRGLTICLEPLSPSETNFINTAAEAIQFVQQFQSPS